MQIPKAAAERIVWALTESAKELAEANPTAFTKAVLSHRNALARIAARKLEIATIIDLGAAKGAWSTMARTIWPVSHAHMIEANHHWERELFALAQTPGYSYEIACAGPAKGDGYFLFPETDPYGGVGAAAGTPGATRVPQVTVDSQCAEKKLKAPYLVKFDTHGFEREILKGATETLKQTNLIVLEAYNYGAREIRFPAMLNLLEDMGFRCVDIGEPLFREHDSCFWQIDFFLVPAARPEVQYSRYK
ncbi:MAG: FkbM family methyltransferase [Rhodospirillaceae bacterium]|nr:FkbM family methyltransferase [Rhodospirillaceae bacterium]